MQARLLPASRGAFWIAAGFLLYRRNPPLLSALTFANMMLAIVFSQLQPIGPFLLLLFSPMIMAVIANACRGIGEGKQSSLVPLSALLLGLREQIRLLLRLGILQTLVVILVVVILDQLLPGTDADALVGTKDEAGKQIMKLDPDELLLLLLHLTLIATAVLPAFWFAPLLMAWHGVPPLKSVFFSLVAVWRNWRAFLVYVMTAMLIGVIAPALLLLVLGLLFTTLTEVISVVLRMLLLLVFAPVLMTGAFMSYRDIFAPEPVAEASDVAEAAEAAGTDPTDGADGTEQHERD